MTKNPPQQLRKSASNADLYSDPSPPRPLRHAHSTLSRAQTTASLSHRPKITREAVARGWNRQAVEELRNRHSIAASPSYGNLIDIDEDIRPQQQQRPPPVPPKIPEERPKVDLREEKSDRAIHLERVRGADEQVARPQVASHPWCPVPAKSKEGPEKYTKPFTDFMTAKYDTLYLLTMDYLLTSPAPPSSTPSMPSLKTSRRTATRNYPSAILGT